MTPHHAQSHTVEGRFEVMGMANQGALRESIRRLLEKATVNGETIDDTAIVVSELVANAIEHGRVEVVAVEIAATPPGQVWLAVSYHRPGHPLIPTPKGMPVPDANRGRGLAIVEALCDTYEAEVGSFGDVRTVCTISD